MDRSVSFDNLPEPIVRDIYRGLSIEDRNRFESTSRFTRSIARDFNADYRNIIALHSDLPRELMERCDNFAHLPQLALDALHELALVLNKLKSVSFASEPLTTSPVTIVHQYMGLLTFLKMALEARAYCKKAIDSPDWKLQVQEKRRLQLYDSRVDGSSEKLDTFLTSNPDFPFAAFPELDPLNMDPLLMLLDSVPDLFTVPIMPDGADIAKFNDAIHLFDDVFTHIDMMQLDRIHVKLSQMSQQVEAHDEKGFLEVLRFKSLYLVLEDEYIDLAYSDERISITSDGLLQEIDYFDVRRQEHAKTITSTLEQQRMARGNGMGQFDESELRWILLSDYMMTRNLLSRADISNPYKKDLPDIIQQAGEPSLDTLKMFTEVFSYLGDAPFYTKLFEATKKLALACLSSKRCDIERNLGLNLIRRVLGYATIDQISLDNLRRRDAFQSREELPPA